MRSLFTSLITTGFLTALAATFGLVIGCSSPSKRNPSSVDGETSLAQLPPLATGKTTWVYSWTNSPQSASALPALLQEKLAAATACIDKISVSQSIKDIPSCELNESAAGPGFDTCDNPFTSHDYGSTLIAVKVNANAHRIGLMTGRFSPSPANEQLTRAVTGNKNFDGFLYDFRASDLGDRALVIRSPDVIDPSESYSLAINGEHSSFRKFADHTPFVCRESTPLKSVLNKWGDHIEFMSLTFDATRDTENTQFRTGEKFNRAGVAALIASEATLFPSSVLEEKLKVMMTRSSEMNDSMNPSACRETESISPRACLAQRVFNSLIEENGTSNRPTYIWKFSLLQRSLVELGVIDTKTAAGVHSSAALLSKLMMILNSSPVRLARASEAYNCMLTVRAQMLPTNFATWGNDPE